MMCQSLRPTTAHRRRRYLDIVASVIRSRCASLCSRSLFLSRRQTHRLAPTAGEVTLWHGADRHRQMHAPTIVAAIAGELRRLQAICRSILRSLIYAAIIVCVVWDPVNTVLYFLCARFGTAIVICSMLGAMYAAKVVDRRSTHSRLVPADIDRVASVPDTSRDEPRYVPKRLAIAPLLQKLPDHRVRRLIVDLREREQLHLRILIDAPMIELVLRFSIVCCS